MAISTTISIFLFTLISSASAIATETVSSNQTIGNAIQEMQKANYFAFVMLLNLVPSNDIPTNVTFLMPNNRILTKAMIPETNVLDFLLRHSIPYPLRFDHLSHFPTGSIIPSSEPNFTLTVSNNGRRSFFFNNVKLISPDICLAGANVRCHGIDGVLTDKTPPPVITAPSPSMPPSGPPEMSVSPDSSPSPDSFDMAPAATPQPAGPDPADKKSGSFGLVVSIRLIVCLFLLSMVHY